MKFGKLIQRVVLRTVREDRFLAVLSVLGVALGVGLYMGVNIAADRAVQSFGTETEGVAPSFNYEVLDSSGIDFAEGTYRSVRAIAEKTLPLLVANAYLPDASEAVEINGIYTVKALPFLGQRSRAKIDIADFLTNLNGVAITKKFSDGHHFKKGDFFRADVYNKEYRLKVVDIVDADGIAGNRIFMDLGNFQDFFGKAGYLTRIDIDADEQAATAIERVLPPGLRIEQKQRILQSRKALVDAFRYNLRFVTFLAVLVGIFLLYNTVFISVIKRRTEIGILRGLGMGRTTVVALFVAQGLILGLVGSLLGILFGQVCAWFSIAAVEKTITQFFHSIVVPVSLITVHDACSTLLLGFAVSFLASLVPALESASVRPNESFREGTFEKTYKGRQRLFSIIGVICILAGTLLVYEDFRSVHFDFPWFSYAGVVLFILGCTLNAPAYLVASLHVLKWPLSRLYKAGARIALGDIKGSSYRFSLALMSVAISSALIIATVSSVYSFKRSFIDWINDYIVADVYIKPASCPSNFCFSPLPAGVVETISHLPGVKTVGRYRALELDFHGQKIVAGFGSANLLARYRPGINGEERERLQRLSDYPEVLISDYLKVKYGLKVGDTIELQTPKGKAAFTVNNTAVSYSTMSGFLYLDRRWLKEYWGIDDATSLSVYLAQGEDPGRFRNEVEKALGSSYALDITDNNELRHGVLRVFDRSFALTYTIELVAIIISLIGVVNALLILVFERKREISVLRYLGASWLDIRLIMVLSAATVGIAGIVLGMFMGSAISVVITQVINKISFGWEVSLQMPFLSVFMLMALLLVTTIIAGLVPSFLARKIDPKAFISFE